eukprot:586478-Rhodomonas_salina.2
MERKQLLSTEATTQLHRFCDTVDLAAGGLDEGADEGPRHPACRRRVRGAVLPARRRSGEAGARPRQASTELTEAVRP